MNDLDNLTTKKLTLRLPNDLYLLLDDLAHSAREPLAVYIRQLLQNRVPPSAPPLELSLSARMKVLLVICRSLSSNLFQLSSNIESKHPNLNQLINPLNALRERARTLGISIKSGNVNDDQTAQYLHDFGASGDELNLLLRKQNAGEIVSNQELFGVLTRIKNALQKTQVEAVKS
jgi:hypothetical protein